MVINNRILFNIENVSSIYAYAHIPSYNKGRNGRKAAKNAFYDTAINLENASEDNALFVNACSDLCSLNFKHSTWTERL